MAVTPTWARRELGRELQRLREATRPRLTQAKAAQACQWSLTKIVRLEGGTVTLTLHDLHLLADLYEANEEERANLIRLAERAEEGQWWQAYGDLVPVVLDEYLALESQATAVDMANFGVFPGLVQSPAYAEAVFSSSAQVPDPDHVAALVELRMRRQRILESGSTELRAIVGEALLMTPTGGTGVLKQQLAHLLDLAERPNVSIQVVPLTSEKAVLTGGLVIFDFEANATSVAYAEHAAGMNAFHGPYEVRRLKRDMAHIRSQAWPTDVSVSQIQARLREL